MADEQKNHYDRFDTVARDAVIIADGAGQLKIAAYRVRDPENGEWGPLQFHMTHDNTVLAVMGAEAAKLFARFVTNTVGSEPGAP